MIVGLIKRAQSLLGCLFCVSGVIGCFRRQALHAVGGWDPGRLTEDIDITWRLQRIAFWMVWFPALYWLLSLLASLAACWQPRRRGPSVRARWLSPDRGLRR